MKKIGRLFLVLLIICAVATLGYAAGKDTIVYITKTGEKYHTEKCSSVRSSKIAIELGEAVERGYQPCRICKPPVLGELGGERNGKIY